MKFIRFGNKVLNISALAHVDMHWPDEDTTDDCVELSLYFIGGNSTTLYGDDALTAWNLIQKNSVRVVPRHLEQAS